MEFSRIQKVVDEHLGTVDLYFPTISYKKLSFMNFSVMAVITYLKEFGIMIFLFKQERAFAVQCCLLND